MTERCDGCGIRLHRDDGYEFILGELVCSDCIAREYESCDECDAIVPDTQYCEWCNVTHCDDCAPYHIDCEPE